MMESRMPMCKPQKCFVDSRSSDLSHLNLEMRWVFVERPGTLPHIHGLTLAQPVPLRRHSHLRRGPRAGTGKGPTITWMWAA